MCNYFSSSVLYCCCFFLANVVVRVPSNTGVVEGEKLTIVCIVVGTDPKLSWPFRKFHFNCLFNHF